MKKSGCRSKKRPFRAIAHTAGFKGKKTAIHDQSTGISLNLSGKMADESNVPSSAAFSRYADAPTAAAETRCDMNYTKKNSEGYPAYQELLKKKQQNPFSDPAFDPVWGVGEPVVDFFKSFHNYGPCMQEILSAHEDEHIKTARTPCMGFKKCLDGKDESWSGALFGEALLGRTVPLSGYIDCFNAHHGGMAPDCSVDEQAAYAETVLKANQLKNEPRCQAEINAINENLPNWEHASKSYKC